MGFKLGDQIPLETFGLPTSLKEPKILAFWGLLGIPLDNLVEEKGGPLWIGLGGRFW